MPLPSIQSKPVWLAVSQQYVAANYREERAQLRALRSAILARVRIMSSDQLADMVVELVDRSDQWEQRALAFQPSDG